MARKLFKISETYLQAIKKIEKDELIVNYKLIICYLQLYSSK